MILVTLGTQKFQFNRLIEAVDAYAATIEEEVFIQTGNSTVVPKNCKHADFVASEEFQKMIASCSVLITHSGVGSIITGINAGRPVIVVPRLAQYDEHVDNHQFDIAMAFASKGCVLHCDDLEHLGEFVDRARTMEFQPYVVHGGKIEDIILDFLKLF